MRAEAYVPGGGSWDVWRQALSRNRHDFFTAVRNLRKDTGGLTVARPSWLSVAGRHRDMDAGIFHVFTHCVWAAPALFRDDTDRISFLRELARASTRVEWTCMAYCLMRTHYHLILGVEDGVLPLGMHAVNFRYACAFNKRHDMRGHVQAARYGSRRIGDDAELMHVFRYVARNPVEAGLCADPADWPWSSYASTIGKADPIAFVDPSRIINCFGDTPERAIAALREYVERSADP